MGRAPLADETARITLRLSAAELAAIDAQAAQDGVTRSEMVRSRLALTSGVTPDATVERGRSQGRDSTDGDSQPAAPPSVLPSEPLLGVVEPCEHRWVQARSEAVGVIYVCGKCAARTLKRP